MIMHYIKYVNCKFLQFTIKAGVKYMKIIKKLICTSLAILFAVFSMTNVSCLAYSEKSYECSKCTYYPNAEIAACSSAFKKIEPNGTVYKFSVNSLYKHPNYIKYWDSYDYAKKSYIDYKYYSYKLFKFSLSKKQLVALNIASDLPGLCAHIDYADGKNGYENGYYMDQFNVASYKFNYDGAAKPSKYLTHFTNGIETMTNMGEFNESKSEFDPEPGYQIINGADVYNLDKGDYVIIFQIDDRYTDQYDGEYYSVQFSVKTTDNPHKLTKPQKVKSNVRYNSSISKYCADISWANQKDAYGYFLFEYDKTEKKYKYSHCITDNKITLQLKHPETKLKIIAFDSYGDISEPFCFTVKVKSKS